MFTVNINKHDPTIIKALTSLKSGQLIVLGNIAHTRQSNSNDYFICDMSVPRNERRW